MSDCRKVQIGEVCYTDAAGVSSTLFVSHVYDVDGIWVGAAYHDAAGVEVDTAGGSVAVGRCTCPQTFVEQGCLKVVTVGVSAFSVISKLDPASYAGAGAPWDTATFVADITGGAHAGWYVYELCAATAPAGTDPNGHTAQPGVYTANPDLDVTDVLTLTGDRANCPTGATELQPVEVIKTIGCDGTVSVLLYDNAGVLLDPQPLASEWSVGLCVSHVETREVCVDTGTAVVEAWIVIVRDAAGVILSTALEDVTGAAVTGTIVDCACPTGTATPLLESRGTYSGSGIQSYYADKWVADCGPITWQVEAYQDGALVYTSPASPALTSGAAAQTWLNTTGGGGYVLLDQFNDQANGNPQQNIWSLPVQSSGDWLIVIKETANPAGPGGCTANVDYGFANYDIASLGNGNPTGWWDAIGVGIDPVSGPALFWYVG